MSSATPAVFIFRIIAVFIFAQISHVVSWRVAANPGNREDGIKRSTISLMVFGYVPLCSFWVFLRDYHDERLFLVVSIVNDRCQGEIKVKSCSIDIFPNRDLGFDLIVTLSVLKFAVETDADRTFIDTIKLMDKVPLLDSFEAIRIKASY